jgi:hypothetical protein
LFVEVVLCNWLFWSLLVSNFNFKLYELNVFWFKNNWSLELVLAQFDLIHPCIWQQLEQCIRSYCITFSMKVKCHKNILVITTNMSHTNLQWIFFITQILKIQTLTPKCWWWTNNVSYHHKAHFKQWLVSQQSLA